jgi:hypothetical protein
LTSFKGSCSIEVIYRLPGPVDGGIGPRHAPRSFATGRSLFSKKTFNSPSVTRTCTKISLDEGSRRNQ